MKRLKNKNGQVFFFHAKQGETFSTPDFAVRMYLMDAFCFMAGVNFDGIRLWSICKYTYSAAY